MRYMKVGTKEEKKKKVFVVTIANCPFRYDSFSEALSFYFFFIGINVEASKWPKLVQVQYLCVLLYYNIYTYTHTYTHKYTASMN